MKKQILAATLSLSLLALGGTALASNNPAPTQQNTVQIESKSCLDLNKTSQTSAAAVSVKGAAQNSGNVMSEGSLNAGVTLNKTADQSVRGAAAGSIGGSVAGGGSSVNGSSSISVERKNGQATGSVKADGSCRGSRQGIDTRGKMEISDDGKVKSINLQFNGQGSADVGQRETAAIVEKIDNEQIKQYIKLAGNRNIIDELEELDELDELLEELEELDELDELGGYAKIVHSVTLDQSTGQASATGHQAGQ